MGVTFWDWESMDWGRDEETPAHATGEKETAEDRVTVPGDSGSQWQRANCRTAEGMSGERLAQGDLQEAAEEGGCPERWREGELSGSPETDCTE